MTQQTMTKEQRDKLHEEISTKAKEYADKSILAAEGLGERLNESSIAGRRSGYYSGYKDCYKELSKEREKSKKLVEALGSAISTLEGLEMYNTCETIKQSLTEYKK